MGNVVVTAIDDRKTQAVTYLKYKLIVNLDSIVIVNTVSAIRTIIDFSHWLTFYVRQYVFPDTL